jgi:DNA-binding response OmpR family regulator
MNYQPLKDCSLLIVEDEPLLVMDIETEFTDSGAELTVTSVLHHATILVEHDAIDAAILDHAIGEKTCAALYDRLNERGIPFIIYTGHTLSAEDRKGGLFIAKPATPGVLVAAVEALICSLDRAKYEPGGDPSPAV